MITVHFTLIAPELPNQSGSADFQKQPDFVEIERLACPLLNCARMEHLEVLSDYSGGMDWKDADMFVDMDADEKLLEFNNNATIIYRRAFIQQYQHTPGFDPEKLSAVFGPAILFKERVWYRGAGKTTR